MVRWYLTQGKAVEKKSKDAIAKAATQKKGAKKVLVLLTVEMD